MKLNFTTEDMQKCYWLTPNQRRDDLIELYDHCSETPMTDDIVNHIKNLGLAEQARRKVLATSAGEFVECPYCKGYHDQLKNIDKLCEKCELKVHISSWDIEHHL